MKASAGMPRGDWPVPRLSLGTWGLLLFALVLAVCLTSVGRRRQLGFMGGVTDEYLALGIKLRVTGTLGLSVAEPSALRAPGYPAFIATVLAVALPAPSRFATEDYTAQGQHVVALAQSIVLAMAAALLFLWLALACGKPLAWLGGLVFGLNPYSVALVGLMHYAVLHWLLLIACGYALSRAQQARRRALALLLAGALLGLANLVRPVTLLAPAILLPALLIQRVAWRRALALAGLCFSGMAALLAPWALRNYALTGRVVAVADNPWATLWGQTVKPLAAQPDHYVWYELYERDLMPIFTSVTGVQAYDYAVAVRHNDAVEAAFRRAALSNIRRAPHVYARNCLTTLISFNTDINAVVISAYEYLQTPEGSGAFPSRLLRVGHPPFQPSLLASCFRVWFAGLSLLALCGGILAVRGRHALLASAGVLYVTACLTHSLVFMHFLHYYVKVPLLVSFAFLALQQGSVRWKPASYAVAGALSVTSLALLSWLLL
jgi:hypothetical protein